MAKKSTSEKQPKLSGEAGATAPQAAQLHIVAQYIRDLSFENAKAPSIFFDKGNAPNIELNVDVKARKLGEDSYEVALLLKASAKNDTSTHFVAELLYAGAFTIRGVPEDMLKPLLLIECPRYLFPFARSILADITRDGGFPPLYLQPFDFAALYRQQNPNAEAQA